LAADLEPRENGTIMERAPFQPAPDPQKLATDQTMEAPTFGVPQRDATTVDNLPARVAGNPDAAPDAIVVGAVIGAGGMGVVHVAEQPTLRREVAVKVLRDERKNDQAVNAMLREAWVMGTLEHPNIVPVHLLLREADGAPQLVMKRIEGVAWDAVIEAPTLAESLGGGQSAARDPLEFHLRVLIAVCHAIHFAHSRGILHLDLKPDNVMVGRFGEVAVLDWGIAASFGARAPEWLPQARLMRGVRGTPAWMAPELASADGDGVGPHTDVYLLGGLLHAILTGDVRHQGDDVRTTLTNAFESAPVAYPRSVPSELAALANQATAAAPAARPESAEAFRRALEDFLGHRSSNALAAEATERLEPFLLRLQSEPDEATSSESIRRDFLECQFAFRQALQLWSDNVPAKEGLQRLLRAMAESALKNRQLERAAECLHALGGDPELSKRLGELAREAVEEHERLKLLERDADPNVNYQKRRWLSLAAALVFVAWNIMCGWLNRSGILPIDLPLLVLSNLATTGIFIASAVTYRETMLGQATNRRLVVLFGSGFLAVLVFWISAWRLAATRPELGLEVLDIVSLTGWVYIYFVLALGFTMDSRVLWLLIPAVAVATYAPTQRAWAFELLGLGGFVVGLGLFIIWGRPQRRRPRAT